jgi:hypothetical protein
MLLSKIWYFIFLGFLGGIKSLDPSDLEIMGIEPNSGPVSGETRVLVRFKDFNTKLIEEYPHPKVKYS